MTYTHNPNWNAPTRDICLRLGDDEGFFRHYWSGAHSAREAVESYIRGEEEMMARSDAPLSNDALDYWLDAVDWDFVRASLDAAAQEMQDAEDCTCGEFRSKKCSVHGDLRHVDPDAARDRMQERESG